MGNSTETKRCRNIRRVLIALFIVCGYLLSTTYAIAPVEVNGKETYVNETALNLAFGEMGGEIPMPSSKVGYLFLILPFVGFFFMFFDKKSNIKNFVGLACGVIGVLSISFFIGGYVGFGGLISIFVYMLIVFLSAISIFLNAQDKKSTKEPPRLDKHE